MHTISNEVVGGRRRRRDHSAEFNAQVVAACNVPGMSNAAVAMAHGIKSALQVTDSYATHTESRWDGWSLTTDQRKHINESHPRNSLPHQNPPLHDRGGRRSSVPPKRCASSRRGAWWRLVDRGLQGLELQP